MADNNRIESGKDNSRSKEPSFPVFVACSVVFHFLLFSAGFININFGKSDFDIQKSSLNVTVVQSSEAAKEEKKTGLQKPSGKNPDIEAGKIEKKTEPEEKKPVFSGTKKRLPKKEVKVSKAPQKKEEEKRSDLSKDIAEIKKEVEKNEKSSIDKVLKDIDSFKKDMGPNNSGNEEKTDNMFSDLEKGAEKSEKIDIYRYKIAYEVERKWALPNELVNTGDKLETSIVFSVLPDGTIHNIWFDRKSGNEYFDNSVYRAVKKAEPLPPHPEGLDVKSVIVGLRFTPEGLR